MSTVGIVGYGEVGRILAEELRARGVEVIAYDLKLADDRRAPLVEHAAVHGVTLAADHASVAETATQLILSAVTADQTVAAAEALSPGLVPGCFVLDLNSASPRAKEQAAEAVDAAGARFVEGAVMTSVPPHRLAVPILLGGPHAAAVAPLLADLGFGDAQVHDPRPGIASASKLCRSVLIKGMEALFIESLVAARHHGVEDAVLASLDETFPGIDWDAQASYFFQRATQHGRRRADEMEQAADTVAQAGIEPWGSLATARRQRWMADLADGGALAPTRDWRAAADAILGRESGLDKGERDDTR